MSLIQHFEGQAIELIPDGCYEFLILTSVVAQGFGVTPENIRYHKSKHADELLESKHWVVRKTHTLGGRQTGTFWTKMGIVRLGFLITSPQAKRFRDWAEDLVITTTSPGSHPSTPASGHLAQLKTMVDTLQLSLQQHEQTDTRLTQLEQEVTMLGQQVQTMKQVLGDQATQEAQRKRFKDLRHELAKEFMRFGDTPGQAHGRVLKVLYRKYSFTKLEHLSSLYYPQAIQFLATKLAETRQTGFIPAPFTPFAFQHLQPVPLPLEPPSNLQPQLLPSKSQTSLISPTSHKSQKRCQMLRPAEPPKTTEVNLSRFFQAGGE